jgi:FkbM family methyltransferase
MLSRLYRLFYRMFFVLHRFTTEGLLRRWPFMAQGLDRFKDMIRGHFTGRVQAWVRIESGLSRGMWIQSWLPGEAGIWRGEHEPEVQKAILAAVKPGDVVYDIGAFLGIMALGTARLVGESGRVLAFDGDPENVARLRSSGVRNGLEGRLQVIHAAVWSRTMEDGIPYRRGGQTKCWGGVEADGNRPVLGNGEIINVPAITLDDIVAKGEPPPKLLKIDVEGGEYEVLRGGPMLFGNQRPLIIAEVHHQQAAECITDWLLQNQYGAQWYIPKEKFPRRLFAWPIEQDGETWMRLL